MRTKSPNALQASSAVIVKPSPSCKACINDTELALHFFGSFSSTHEPPVFRYASNVILPPESHSRVLPSLKVAMMCEV